MCEGATHVIRGCFGEHGWSGASVMQRSRNDDVREEEIPAFVTPEDLQAKQGFIPLGAPELAAAFHSTLHLPTRGFDCSRAQGFTAPLSPHILHALLVVPVVLDGLASSLGSR